jgi:CheY-like chemotaxis protein
MGAGSRFFVELPLASVASAAPSAPLKALPDRLPPALRILVAEDNPINQKVICAMLRRQGCEIVLAGNGAEACRQFLAATFDLVLMDVQMPEVDGLEATRRIRAEEIQRRLPRTPVLALTAHASRQQHEQCLACGMDAVITKPVNMPELVRHIAALVAHDAVC